MVAPLLAVAGRVAAGAALRGAGTRAAASAATSTGARSLGARAASGGANMLSRQQFHSAMSTAESAAPAVAPVVNAAAEYYG